MQLLRIPVHKLFTTATTIHGFNAKVADLLEKFDWAIKLEISK